MTILASGCTVEKSQPSEKVIRLGFFANLMHAPAIIGMERGDFESGFAPLGVKVEPVLFSSGPAVIEAMYANRLDVAYVGPGPALNGYVRSGGKEILVVSGCAANGVAVVARKDSSIRSWSDLAGKRVAVPAIGNTQFLSATFFLDRLTTSPDAKKKTAIIPVSNADAALLLKKGQVDAAWLPEPWAAMLEIEEGMVFVGEESDLWAEREFPSAVLVVRREFATRHPEWVKRFVGIHETLCAELQSETKELAPRLADGIYQLSKKRIRHDVVARALGRIRFTTDPLYQQINRFYEMAQGSGFLRSMQRVSLNGLVSDKKPTDPADSEFSALGSRAFPSNVKPVPGDKSR